MTGEVVNKSSSAEIQKETKSRLDALGQVKRTMRMNFGEYDFFRKRILKIGSLKHEGRHQEALPIEQSLMTRLPALKECIRDGSTKVDKKPQAQRSKSAHPNTTPIKKLEVPINEIMMEINSLTNELDGIRKKQIEEGRKLMTAKEKEKTLELLRLIDDKAIQIEKRQRKRASVEEADKADNYSRNIKNRISSVTNYSTQEPDA